MGLRVEIDQDECMSSGKCVADHPDAFDFDDEELAVTRAGAQKMSDDDARAALEASDKLYFRIGEVSQLTGVKARIFGLVGIIIFAVCVDGFL